jgi:hypothetical protein
MLKSNQMLGYPQEYINIYYALREGGTIREFINILIQMSNAIENYDDKQKFKGDMLEVLSEIFFNAFSMDESVGVSDYTPVALEDDYGVDGFGVNANGHNVAVQVKFRSRPTELVTYAEVSRTYTSGKIMHNLDLDHDKTIYVFTTANGVTNPCEEVLGRRMVVIARPQIAHKVDNNKLFWKFAYEQILEKIPTE